MAVLTLRDRQLAKLDRGNKIELGLGLYLDQDAEGLPIIADVHMVSSLIDRSGVQDATTAIQDKIDEVSSVYGGGGVAVPSGIFSATQLK